MAADYDDLRFEDALLLITGRINWVTEDQHRAVDNAIVKHFDDAAANTDDSSPSSSSGQTTVFGPGHDDNVHSDGSEAIVLPAAGGPATP